MNNIDKPGENCAVFGIYGHKEASKLTYLGLYSLQHRGQEGCGIVSSDGSEVFVHKGRGLVSDVFSSPGIFRHLKGYIAIGHNRYSTTGSNLPSNVQPFVVECRDGPLAISHNGNFVNTNFLRKLLVKEGSIFQTSTDSELLVHIIARSKEENLVLKLKECLAKIKGAYSIVMLVKDKLIAVRDPNGFRPLCIGKKRNCYIITSESCALDLLGAEYQRDVKPGELIVIDKNGLSSHQIFQPEKLTFCIFEFIYFSRPDSKIFGEYVDKTRRKLGKNLALEKPANADIVISVPDSSNTAALGYSHKSGIKFELGLIRNHYIGRTFIQPSQPLRDFNVKVKFNAVGGVIKNRRIVVVEDSIVRGTTLKMLARLIKNAGAKEIHIRVSSPPIRYPCYYGMDFPTEEELIASSLSVEEIRKFLNVDSLGYLSIQGLLDSVPKNDAGFCTACFSGDYPVPIEERLLKNQYEIFNHIHLSDKVR